MNRVIRDISDSFSRSIKKAEVDKDSPKIKSNNAYKANLRIIESIRNQLRALRSREQLLKDKEKILKEKEEVLKERDEALLLQEKAIKERDAALETRNKAIVDTYVDTLTGCYNRNFFEKFIKENSNPNTNHNKIGLVYVDINDLKSINDSFGHEAGDKLITDFAKFLESNFRKNHDKVIRLGGDEFVIICFNYRNNPNFETCLFEKLKKSCELKPPAKFAFGVAVFNKNLDYNLSYAKNRADKAMYECKKKIKKTPNAFAINSQKKLIADFISRKSSNHNT